MTATLTQRYVEATVRRIAPAAQEDVRIELEASIADAVEARIEQGQTREQGERAVLTELGDPGILAASYSDRPLHLIGPRFYLTWWRLLKLLWIIVPVCAAAGVTLAQLIEEATAGELIAAALAAGLGAVVHVAFWVTLVFVVLERTGGDAKLTDWNVDQLPETAPDRAGRSDMIASLIFVVLGVGAVIWDQVRGFFPTGGDPIPILDPQLWPWWIIGLFALIVAEGALAVAIYVRRRWTTGFAIVNSALAVLAVSWGMTLLGRGDLVNPAFIDFAFSGVVDDEVVRILAVLTGFMIVGIATWDAIDGWLKARRAQRVRR